MMPNWQSFIFVAVFLFTFLSYYTGLWYFRGAILIIGTVCLSWLVLYSTPRSIYSLTLLFVLLGLFSLISSLHNGGVSVVVLLIMVSQLSIAYCALKFDGVAHVFVVSYYSFLAFTVFLVGAYGFGAEEFDRIFDAVGRNGYSAILFALMIGYCITQFYNSQIVSVTPILITFLVMFPLYGRSSIFAAGLVLVAVVYRRFRHRIYIGYIVTPVLFAISSRYFNLDDIFVYTNFRSGVDSERWDVINEWLEVVKPMDLLTGVNLSALNTVNGLDGNPHNAFLRLQSFFGAAVVAIFMLLFVTLYYLVLDRMYFFLVIFISIIFKCFFDIIFFIGDLDFLLYPVLFYVFFRKLFSERMCRQNLLRCMK